MSGGKGTALVTGAGKRIGRVIAETLARDGWSVGVHYNQSRSDADDVVAAIAASGGRAVALQADLADTAALARLIDHCADAFSPPTALINNASLFAYDDFASMTLASWQRHVAINASAPVFLAKAMAERLPEDQAGAVVNIVDQRVWRLTPEFFSYTASKALLWDTTRMLAQALAPRIRVNAIGPGPVLQSIHQAPADFADEVAATPLGRQTAPEEIADAVRFILDAPSMTGQMIALDSGQHLSWERDPAGRETNGGGA